MEEENEQEKITYWSSLFTPLKERGHKNSEVYTLFKENEDKEKEDVKG